MALLWSCRFFFLGGGGGGVSRYGDVIRHSAEERPIKHTLILDWLIYNNGS